MRNVKIELSRPYNIKDEAITSVVTFSAEFYSDKSALAFQIALSNLVQEKLEEPK